jgi:hypothetical protein
MTIPVEFELGEEGNYHEGCYWELFVAAGVIWM